MSIATDIEELASWRTPGVIGRDEVVILSQSSQTTNVDGRHPGYSEMEEQTIDGIRNYL